MLRPTSRPRVSSRLFFTTQVLHKHRQCVETLLDFTSKHNKVLDKILGVKLIDAADNSGVTALHMAAASGETAVRLGGDDSDRIAHLT